MRKLNKKMIKITTEIILKAEGGTELRDYLEEALIIIKSSKIEECLVSFNGWYYLIGTKYNTTLEELFKVYHQYMELK